MNDNGYDCLECVFNNTEANINTVHSDGGGIDSFEFMKYKLYCFCHLFLFVHFQTHKLAPGPF